MSKRQAGYLDLNTKENTGSDDRKKKKIDSQPESFVMKPAKSHKWIIAVAAIVVAVIALAVFLIVRDNNSLRVTEVVVADEQVPAEFDGFRILQLSDFNGKSFGRDNRRLVDIIRTLDFDIAILTGDFLDASGSTESFAPINELLEVFGEIGKPVYYVLGENDVDVPDNAVDGWNRCIEADPTNFVVGCLESAGAQCVYPITEIVRGNSRIFLTGITYYEKIFDSYGFDSDKDFSICVTHAPIDYDVDKRLASVNRYGFNEVDFDLSLSGHTLGGQYRLPLLKTLYLEGHGLFPQEEYAYGLHKIQGRYSFITAGLGVKKGFRLFDKPEIAVIELRYSG